MGTFGARAEKRTVLREKNGGRRGSSVCVVCSFFFLFDGQCDTGVMVAEAAFSEGVIVYHTWYVSVDLTTDNPTVWLMFAV